MHIAATQSVTLHIILAIPHTSLRAGTEFSLNSNHLPMAALNSEKIHQHVFFFWGVESS
jgi:hypothetical protein